MTPQAVDTLWSLISLMLRHLRHSCHITLVCRCCLLFWPIWEAPALQKTRNQLFFFITPEVL